MNWFIDDYSRTEILITNGAQEFYIPKFRIEMEISGDYVTIYWNDRERGTGGDQRSIPLNYLDVVDGYSGYIDNPTSAVNLAAQIDAMIDSAWTSISTGGGDLLTAKADLLSHDGVSDTILPGGTNEYILSRNNTTQTGLEWIAKTSIYSNAMAVAAVGEYSYAIGFSSTVVAPDVTTEEILHQILIPGGTLGAGDLVDIYSLSRKTAGAGSLSTKIYLNSVNTVGGAGATLYLWSTGGATTLGLARILFRSATSQVGTIGAAIVPYGTFGNAPSTGTLDVANDIYCQVTVQKGTATDDVELQGMSVVIHKYRP